MTTSSVTDAAAHPALGPDWTVAEVGRLADGLKAIARGDIAGLDMSGVERMDLCGLQLLLRLAVQRPSVRILASQDCLVRGIVRCAGFDGTLKLEERT
jgi:hypothetical protein